MTRKKGATAYRGRAVSRKKAAANPAAQAVFDVMRVRIRELEARVAGLENERRCDYVPLERLFEVHPEAREREEC